MEAVSLPENSVLYGKYDCVSSDNKHGKLVKHPVGMESFVIERPNTSIPVVIPVQLAVTWTKDVIETLDNQTLPEKDCLLVTAAKAGIDHFQKH